MFLLDRMGCVVSDSFCSIVIRIWFRFINCGLDLLLFFCSQVMMYCWLGICCAVRLVMYCWWSLDTSCCLGINWVVCLFQDLNLLPSQGLGYFFYRSLRVRNYFPLLVLDKTLFPMPPVLSRTLCPLLVMVLVRNLLLSQGLVYFSSHSLRVRNFSPLLVRSLSPFL